MTLHPKTLETIPLALALHLATYTVMGLFGLFGGVLNVLDPTKYLQAIGFFVLTGFCWGYVFGLLMVRKEVVLLGYVANAAFAVLGAWVWLKQADMWMGMLFLAVGVYGLFAITKYRRQILEE